MERHSDHQHKMHKGSLRVALVATLPADPDPGVPGKQSQSLPPPPASSAPVPGRLAGGKSGQHGTANTRRHLPIIPPTIPRITIRYLGDALFPGISSNEEAPPRPSQNLWEASMNFLQQCGSYHVSFERTGFDTKQSALLGRSRKRLEAER